MARKKISNAVVLQKRLKQREQLRRKKKQTYEKSREILFRHFGPTPRATITARAFKEYVARCHRQEILFRSFGPTPAETIEFRRENALWNENYRREILFRQF